MAEAGGHPRRPGRTTRQGTAVLGVVRSSPGFRSAQEIHAALRASGEQVGLATVYRHLQILTDRGVIDALQAADGQILYRQCASDVHHHHLICRRCGTSVEIEAPDVEVWAADTASGMGYADVTHTIEIFGICPRCQRGDSMP